VTGVDEANVGVGDVALEGFGFGPPASVTASSGTRNSDIRLHTSEPCTTVITVVTG
jgi:hypothetical protein